MSVINSQPLIGASGQSTGPYTLSKSLRFRASASAYLNRTFSTPTSALKYTFSAWVKRGLISSAAVQMPLISAGGADGATIRFNENNDTFRWYDYVTGYSVNLVTSAVYRDPAAWYHVVCAYDSTQATSTDRAKIYINGVQVTAFSATSYPTLNQASGYLNTAIAHNIGRNIFTPANLADGYMAEVNFIDGQGLTPTSFGSFSGTGGVWQPIAYTGTYGTNGFYLKFTNTTSTATLGNDSSGNSNTWTVNNISLTAGSTYDSMTDVPTLTSATAANYAAMNPIVAPFADTSSFSISNGNLYVSGTGGLATSTIGVSAGKFYAEIYPTGVNASSGFIGIWQQPFTYSANSYGSSNTNYRYYGSNGTVYNTAGSSVASYASWTSSDVIGIALDMDNGTLKFYKNNTLQGTAVTGLTGTWFISYLVYTSSAAYINFGQQPFTYTPPSGYVALNTYNLPTPTIAAGNKYMDATLYTGTLLSNSITNAGAFKPDLVWVKSRSAATDHKLTDSVRGVTKGLISNTQGVETTDTQGLTAINSNGFTVGTDTNYNNLTATYVAWQWQAGQGSTSSNTSGSITSTVSVNASAGFSIVTYTGNNTAGATIGHGLGVKPNLIIIKNKNVGTTNWLTYSSVLGATKFLKIESTDGAGTSILPFNNTEPTSSVFSVGAWDVPNGSGNSHIAYCWTEIAGFSKFGSYTGNGSSDGPFIYTGFRPKFIIIKCTTTSNSWGMFDSSRDTYNANYKLILPNSSNAEDTGSASIVSNDFLSNGFKLRGNWSGFNTNNDTYVYMAFAETPTKFANAR